MSRVLTDEEAFALGVRAIEAGIRPAVGVRTISLDCGQLRDTGVITGIVHGNRIEVSEDLYPLFAVDETVSDFRDPGTRGHAIEQLRERTRDQYLIIEWHAGRRLLAMPHAVRIEPNTWHARVFNVRQAPHLTEEEAIVATFEATKEKT